MDDESLQHYETKFHEYLRSIHKNGSRPKNVVLRCLLRATKPISASELLYPAKQEDLHVSLCTVYSALKLIVAAGLATKTLGQGGTRYAHALIEQCVHRHVVCKDCGVAVDVEDQKASKEVPAVD